MGYLIENNSFSSDTYGIRAARLNFLSANIDTYAAELSLTGSLLSWAQDTTDLFNSALVKQSVETGEKDESFQTSQEAVQALMERYQILKDILISRYSDNDQKLNIYGIKGISPRNQTGIVAVSRALIGGNTSLKASGDPNVLPDAMISSFQILVDDAENKYLSATMERQQALDANNELRVLYDQGSINLRALYNWVIASWSKYDPRLIVLGFTQATQSGGGRVPGVPVNLAYDEASHVFSWDEVLDTTSYQLAYCLDGQPVQEWMSEYSGTENNTIFEPGDGDWLVKIRARNVNGYSDWSLTQNVHYESGLPAPGYITVSLTDPLLSTIALTWEEISQASYKLYKSSVAIGAPAGTYELVGEYAEASYQGTATAPNRHYFHVVAFTDTKTSLPSDSVYIDIQLVP